MFTTSFIKTFTSIILVISLNGIVKASPANKRYVEYFACSDKWQQLKLINDMTILGIYANGPLLWLQDHFDANANFYNHYFRPEDRQSVTNAFNAFRQSIVQDNRGQISFLFYVECLAADDATCIDDNDPEDDPLAVTDPAPVTPPADSDITPGLRPVMICPDYFTFPTTTRAFPLDASSSAEYCANAAANGNKYSSFATGTHTLMHEVSHLDNWGLFANYEERTQNNDDPRQVFNYHGTDDYNGDSSAQIARGLRVNGDANFKTYWNAESLAAFALEYFAFTYCGVADVAL